MLEHRLEKMMVTVSISLVGMSAQMLELHSVLLKEKHLEMALVFQEDKLVQKLARQTVM